MPERRCPPAGRTGEPPPPRYGERDGGRAAPPYEYDGGYGRTRAPPPYAAPPPRDGYGYDGEYARRPPPRDGYDRDAYARTTAYADGGYAYEGAPHPPRDDYRHDGPPPARPGAPHDYREEGYYERGGPRHDYRQYAPPSADWHHETDPRGGMDNEAYRYGRHGERRLPTTPFVPSFTSSK